MKTVVCAAVACAVVAGAIGCGSEEGVPRASEAPAPCRDPAPVTGTEPVPPSTGPYPTISCDQQRGIEILRNDPVSRRLLAGNETKPPGEFTEFGVEWYTCDGDRGGTVVDLELERPLTGGAEWPVLIDECGRPTRVELRCHFVENATELTVRVDLETNEVVSINPGGTDVRIDGRLPSGTRFDQLPPGC